MPFLSNQTSPRAECLVRTLWNILYLEAPGSSEIMRELVVSVDDFKVMLQLVEESSFRHWSILFIESVGPIRRLRLVHILKNDLLLLCVGCSVRDTTSRVAMMVLWILRWTLRNIWHIHIGWPMVVSAWNLLWACLRSADTWACNHSSSSNWIRL